MHTTRAFDLQDEIFLADDTLITSKTDLQGRITYGNQDFVAFSGFREKEFLHKPHNLIRHPIMPRCAFKLLWDFLALKLEFFAFVCNLNKQGKTYWVFANITPSYNEKGEVISYYSVRRRPSKKGVETCLGIYQKLLEIEKEKGMEAGVQFVLNFLEQNKISWDELMINLQNEGKEGGYR